MLSSQRNSVRRILPGVRAGRSRTRLGSEREETSTEGDPSRAWTSVS